MKKFFAEFKEFISKGNAMGMAIGIIIGGAFTSIVNSICENILAPIIGLICGKIDFSALAITVGETKFGIGNVITAIIQFLLTALVLFWIVKGMNTVQKKLEKKKEEAAPAEPDEQTKLLMEIRDLLKENK